MKKTQKVAFTIVAIAFAIYVGFLVKKSFVDEGWSSEDEMKQDLLGKYVIKLGLPDTDANRKKYSKMTIEQLKKELGFDTEVIE